LIVFDEVKRTSTVAGLRWWTLIEKIVYFEGGRSEKIIKFEAEYRLNVRMRFSVCHRAEHTGLQKPCERVSGRRRCMRRVGFSKRTWLRQMVARVEKVLHDGLVTEPLRQFQGRRAPEDAFSQIVSESRYGEGKRASGVPPGKIISLRVVLSS
jgi:hypothetical protein